MNEEKKPMAKIEGGGSAGMTDAGFSKKSEAMRREQLVCTVFAIVGAIGCIVTAVLQHFLPAAALFAVSAVGILRGEGVRKRKIALTKECFGEFFRTELENAFGPELHTEKMRIDRPLMQALCPPEGAWEECRVEHFREGRHGRLHFSVANVSLKHLYRKGTPQEGYETAARTVFSGLVLRCMAGASCDAATPVSLCASERGRGAAEGEIAPFWRCRIQAEPEDLEALSQGLGQLKAAIEKSVEGRVRGMSLEGGVFTLALETDYVFCGACESARGSSADEVREGFRSSLRELEGLLDLLLESTALFVG